MHAYIQCIHTCSHTEVKQWFLMGPHLTYKIYANASYSVCRIRFYFSTFPFSVFKEHSLERDATLGLGTLRLSPFLRTAPDRSQVLVTDEVQELRVGPWPQLPRKAARWKQGRLYKSFSSRILCREASKGMFSWLRYLPRCLSGLEPSWSV